MALDRKSLLARKTELPSSVPFDLPSGDSVALRIPTGKDYREWQRSLRDDKGEITDECEELSSELLIATILVNPDGSPMFTKEEVLDHAMEGLLQADFSAILGAVHQLYGIQPGFLENIEKNSSATQPSEQ